MNVLAIDTATERCSVVLRTAGTVIERSVETPRGHAELVLPMVEAVLGEAGLGPPPLAGVPYGRGAGALPGVLFFNSLRRRGM
ncbi:MAG: tRNA (adenosine(37)-N6)-threonylcarbamoyltransferase complex dimerization subunit type 1 TsaB, partial [Proteobacteria bacterium]